MRFAIPLVLCVTIFAAPAFARDIEDLHSEFAVAPLNDLAGNGGQAVRMLVVNGYGSPIVAIEAVRRSGEGPRITVRTARDDFAGRRVIAADLPVAAWSEIAAGARNHRNAPTEVANAPITDEDNEVIALCTDGWTTTIATHGFGRPRVLERNSCDRDVDAVYSYGWTLERIAIAAFVGCDRLDPDHIRPIADRLSFCATLSDERGVAVSAYNAAAPFVEHNFASPRLPFILADDFSVATSEAQAQGDEAVTLWRAVVASGRYRSYIHGGSGAEDENWRQVADFVVVMYDLDWPDQRAMRFARIFQRWRRDESGLWLLSSMQVEPFQVATID